MDRREQNQPAQGSMRSQTSQTGEYTRKAPVFRPNVDTYETDTELVVVADMPGVAKDGAEIRFENGVLMVHGHVPPREQPGTELLLREYDVGDFHRTFQLSEDVDPAGISAEMSNGLLTVRLPKSESAKPRRIKVRGT